ncbi:hypothetical protein HOM50_02070 [bacterium]|jgi:hypothetical protein|nr:hypothetical protein [bacterium]MBT5015169.1 hypothetical protein [bacterium]
MKKLMLSLVALVAIAGFPGKTHPISAGAGVAIGAFSFLGALILVKGLCSCCGSKSRCDCGCKRVSEKDYNKQQAKQGKFGRAAKAA